MSYEWSSTTLDLYTRRSDDEDRILRTLARRTRLPAGEPGASAASRSASAGRVDHGWSSVVLVAILGCTPDGLVLEVVGEFAPSVSLRWTE
jgi:hypothetical protein